MQRMPLRRSVALRYVPHVWTARSTRPRLQSGFRSIRCCGRFRSRSDPVSLASQLQSVCDEPYAMTRPELEGVERTSAAPRRDPSAARAWALRAFKPVERDHSRSGTRLSPASTIELPCMPSHRLGGLAAIRQLVGQADGLTGFADGRSGIRTPDILRVKQAL